MEIIYSQHAEGRLRKRKITPEEVEQTIKYPDTTNKIGDKFYSQKNIGRAKIEVVYERDKYIKIITVYYI